MAASILASEYLEPLIFKTPLFTLEMSLEGFKYTYKEVKSFHFAYYFIGNTFCSIDPSYADWLHDRFQNNRYFHNILSIIGLV
ncbi:hypothetical protein [Anaerotaenia torta]|uniref:hypothetical protein n=1 Tax=Anaerotaenia torta TaxID=433293 RepID=UPI003D1A6F19